MATLDFYFDYRSPYAYLAQTQIRNLGVDIAWRPFEILQLMDKVGNVPTSIICKPKSRYLGADLARWVGLYKVPFQRHPKAGNIDGRRLLRATLAAAELGQTDAAVAAIVGALGRLAVRAAMVPVEARRLGQGTSLQPCALVVQRPLHWPDAPL